MHDATGRSDTDSDYVRSASHETVEGGDGRRDWGALDARVGHYVPRTLWRYFSSLILAFDSRIRRRNRRTMATVTASTTGIPMAGIMRAIMASIVRVSPVTAT